MMTFNELSPQSFLLIEPLLGKYSQYPVVRAVLEGKAPGRVFVDDHLNPKSAYVLTLAGFSYTIGNPQNSAFSQGLKDLLFQELFPQIKVSSDPTLIFYPLSDGWGKVFKDILTKVPVHDLYRKQFEFKPEKFTQIANQQGAVPAGFSLVSINQQQLDKMGADMFPWESPQAFLAHGFGFWMLAKEDLACECRTVFIGGGAVEIDIHTEEDFRKRGLATYTCAAFITECLARGLRPNWECWWDNEPSIALAIKLGFDPVCDAAVFLVELA